MKILGATISLEHIRDGRATLRVGDESVTCAEGQLLAFWRGDFRDVVTGGFGVKFGLEIPQLHDARMMLSDAGLQIVDVSDPAKPTRPPPLMNGGEMVLTGADTPWGDIAEETKAAADAAMYWSAAQIVAHHASNGCNLQPGDLIGTGTLSTGDDRGLGSLLEISRGGKQPLKLPGGETRSFLEDGDELTLRAWCEAEGRAPIGFGECVGRVSG